jgi:hypothetical protein
MRAKKRPKPKSKTVIRRFSAQRLTIQYAELLRLRQAVHQAELSVAASRSGSSDLRSN